MLQPVPCKCQGLGPKFMWITPFLHAELWLFLYIRPGVCLCYHFPFWSKFRTVIERTQRHKNMQKIPKSVKCQWRPSCMQVSTCNWCNDFAVDIGQPIQLRLPYIDSEIITPNSITLAFACQSSQLVSGLVTCTWTNTSLNCSRPALTCRQLDPASVEGQNREIF